MVRALLAIFALAFLSSAETAEKKPPLTDGKTDNWQKSKECAAQAEKVMADRDRRLAAFGGPGSGADEWENHYSRKYDRCFISAYYFISSKKPYVKGSPSFSTLLIDAFERSTVARSAGILRPEFACGDAEKPAECEQAVRSLNKRVCQINDKEADCEKAASFISEHMKD